MVGWGREPENLIAQAVENVHIFGDIILRALKDGEATEAIRHRLQEYVSTVRSGFTLGKVDTEMTVLGFADYFKKKGLV
ncbi:hypothetical protein ACFLXT_03155 [Chloroflexota bacterium]